MLSIRFPDRRGMAIAFHGSGSGAGEALGPIAVGFILVTWLAEDWRMYTMLSFIPAIAITIAMYWLLSGARTAPSEAPAHRPKLTDTVRLLRYPVYVSLAYANFTRSFSHFGLLSFMPVYLAQDLGMDSSGVGLHVGLLTLLGVVTGPFFGYFSDRIGRRIPIVAAMVVMSISMFIMGAVGSGILLTLALAFAGLFIWSSQDVINATVLDAAPPGLQGSTVGLMFLSSLSGASAGVVLMGFVVDLTDSYRSIFWLAGGVAAPSAVILAFAPLRRHTESTEVTS